MQKHRVQLSNSDTTGNGGDLTANGLTCSELEDDTLNDQSESAIMAPSIEQSYRETNLMSHRSKTLETSEGGTRREQNS